MTGFCSSSTVGPTAVMRGRGLAKRETGVPAAAAAAIATATAGIVDYLAAMCLRRFFWGFMGCCRRRSGDAARCRKERSGSALGHSSLMDVRFRSPRAHEPCSDARCASGSDSQPATLSLRGDGSLHAHPTSLSAESSTTTENPLPALSSRGLLIFNIAAKSPTARTTLLLFFQGCVACCP
jgi:hypothetical protein